MSQEIILIGYIDDEDFIRLGEELRRQEIIVHELYFGKNVNQYTIEWELSTSPLIKYNDKLFSQKLFQSACIIFVKWWHMHTPDFVVCEEENENYQKFSSREWKSLIECILLYYYQLYKHKWIGDPVNLQNSNIKQFLLKLSIGIGFNLPTTVISNNHRHLSNKYNWVSKAVGKNQSISANEEFYTVKVNEEVITEHVLNKFLHAPALFQHLINKDYEVRAYHIHQKIIAVKIESHDKYIDSRYRGDFFLSDYELPLMLQEQIINLGKITAIDYFAIDILVDSNGQFWLTDITPEASWFSYESTQDLRLTLPISRILYEIIMDKKMNYQPAKWHGRPIELVKSERGSLHCFQACLVMALKAMKNIEITLEEAESLTNFVAGRDTWPHKGFLTFAANGIHVTSIETMNPKLFVNDPVKEINRIYEDSEIAQYIVGITDIEVEKKLLEECLKNSLIKFEVRNPEINDVIETLETGGLVLANINYGTLHNTEKYEGHMVIITEINTNQVCLFDPGPPGDANWHVDRTLFMEALFPDGSSGQLILLNKNS